MVALFIVALILPALMFALSQQTDSVAYLRDKSMAHVVASNKLVELQLLAKAQGELLAGEDNGVSHMGDRDWYWWVQSKDTDVRFFRRMEITVADSEESRATPLYTLVAFLPTDFKQDVVNGQ